MSYDLAVWYAAKPITTQQAAEIYEQMVDNDEILMLHAGVRAFLRDLVAKYPRLEDCSDKQAEVSPWSGSFDYSDRHVVMNMQFSRAKEVREFVVELASRHDLVVYDPQTPVVIYTPRLEELPHRRLTLENRQVFDDPTDAEIAKALASLKLKGNSFAIFELQSNTYMQTLKQGKSQYIIEYRAGSADKHFHAFSTDLAEITAAFQAYAAKKATWKKQFAWEKLEL